MIFSTFQVGIFREPLKKTKQRGKTLKLAISIFITMQSFLLYRSLCGSDS